MTNVKERSKYILMDKIQPPVTKNYIIRAELPKPVLADVVSELGFYGILIRYAAEYYEELQTRLVRKAMKKQC